jgi:hypothetical protein
VSCFVEELQEPGKVVVKMDDFNLEYDVDFFVTY